MALPVVNQAGSPAREGQMEQEEDRSTLRLRLPGGIAALWAHSAGLGASTLGPLPCPGRLAE